jgi:DNA-binding Xre family transcriptional regulator
MKQVQRKIPRTSKERAKLKADRERYQREKPTPEQLLAQSGHERFVRHGDYLMLLGLMAAIKKEREHQELTMAELSKRTGIDEAALSRLETGKNANPTLETLNRIAAALGKSLICSLKDTPKKDTREKVAS